MRLLMVEDSEAYVALVKMQLADAGGGEVHVRRAPTLAAAREAVVRDRPDCVLLDLGLPDADGLDALDVLRAAAPGLPIVVLTGWTHDDVALRAVKTGAQDVLIKGDTSGPALLRAVRHAVERKHSEQRLATLAMSDALTGLPNRALLLERAHLALDRMAASGGRPVGLLFLDLDRFKLINDSLGHQAGDAFLVGVASRLHAAARPGDTVARFGGDEFAVLCDGVDGEAELEALAARISAALGEPLDVAGTEVFPSGSIGMALATGRDDSPERLLREADAAMYRAKAAGRPSARYDAAMHDGARRALRTESELNQALRRGELVLHYQPLVRLADRAIRGVEALVRWHHPERGLVGPDEFIGTAEDTGLIRRLGAWVLDEACAQLAAWRAAGLAADLPVSVNLSPRQLDDEALVMRVADVLAEHGLDPAALVLEVTETVLLADDGAALARLRALKALGVGIALDARVALDGSLMSLTNTRPGDEAAGRGRGTGWSSLSSLGSLPVDALKLDRSFIRRMGEQPQARRIVTAVLGLARSMGLEVVAEGIEDEERAETLAALGCEIGQGHVFSPAVPAIAMETLLARDVPRPAERIRLFLCDDAPELRALLRAFLEWGGDVDIVGEAEDGEGLAEAVREAEADVVLLDLSMPRVDGLEALAELRADDPALGIVVLSGFEPSRMAAKALALGADRYLEKAAGMEDVRATVRAVAAGRRGPGALLEAIA
ncbi:MAG: EAL domain-containing protein [Solirubrobacteraceae bacterium]